MDIAIIGTGYVGLVSGTCFAELGHNVTCVDNDKSKVEDLSKGVIPIFEPGLEELVTNNVSAGKLSFTSDLEQAVKNSQVVFIAVGTPHSGEDGGADLSYVYSAVEELSPLLKDGALIVTKSTVPVGTGDEIRSIVKKLRPDLEFSISSNPEFLREGCAVKDFLNPDRIIVGVDSDSAKKSMEEIYKPLTDQNVDILFTDISTSELTKYAANAYLATKISFINEIADICEKVGANIDDVARGMGTDHRIGLEYLKPGPGFGGSCFPKDTMALRKIAEDSGAPTKIVESVIYSNERRKHAMAEKIIAECGGVENKTIAVLGLAFKANTDDMRYSSALMIVPVLRRAGASIRAYDPEAMEQAEKLLSIGDITWCEDSYDAVKGADAVAIITEWDEFKNIDRAKLKELLNTPLIIDLRNLFCPKQMAEEGFNYVSVGR